MYMRTLAAVVVGWVLLGAIARAALSPVELKVDATDAPRKLLRATLHIPAKAGPLQLWYPKWIPGEHGPTGPINDLVGVKFSAGGKAIPWTRDPENMFAFNVNVPDGVDAIDAALEFFYSGGKGQFSAGESVTPKLACISWNHVVLYPAGAKAREIQYTTSIKLPKGWKFGTAMPVAKESDELVEFKPVSLETLVDAPLIAGEHFRTIDLTPGKSPAHYLHIVSDSAAALEVKDEQSAKIKRLVAEAKDLYGSTHYRAYHFLLTLSEHVDHFGLEHHESSDNRSDEDLLTDEGAFKIGMSLLPHEMTHSWNGKYRRPEDIATPDFEQPMKTELLWVYEGLTTYLGDVLTARSGLQDEEMARAEFAWNAAELDHRGGREWRTLADTAVAAQLLYGSSWPGSSRRRQVDFYPEGKLIWLDADVTIRQLTNGKKSLDDFCKIFLGGESGEPKVVTYTLDDLVAALNKVAANDWKKFFDDRVYKVNPRAPIAGINNGGWKLVFKDERTELQKGIEGKHHFTDARYSLGFSIGKEGGIEDVIPDSPADKGGMSSGMKLIAVNGRKMSPELFRAAIKRAKDDSKPIELLVENDDFYQTFKIDYHEGEKYPWLERDASKPDLLGEILKGRTPGPATKATDEKGESKSK
jgi:predicted metalloprotease with PDZ domain